MKYINLLRLKYIKTCSLLVCLTAFLGTTINIVNAKNISDKTDIFTFDDIEFKPNTQWQKVGDITLTKDKTSFDFAQGDHVLLNRPLNKMFAKGNRLETLAHYQDVHLSVDFNITPTAASGIYFLGRYRLNISNIYQSKNWWPGSMGGIHPRFDDDREWKNFDGVRASKNPAKAPGEWQKLEVDFKAPRFDKNGYKTEYAQFVQVKFNGVVIHQHQIATGPSRYAIALDEPKTGPIIIMGDSAPIVFKNLRIEAKDFSAIPAAKPLKKGDETPMGAVSGKPMYNVVEHGKQLFQDKGCKECHATQSQTADVKTGPNLYGVFSHPTKTISIYDSAEKHQTKVNADAHYLLQSLRQSTLKLAIRKQHDGKQKVFPPIMPSFNSDALSDNDAKALFAYLQTLNSDRLSGRQFIWQEKPEKPYVLSQDLTAELISDKTRIARVNIGTEVSGRAYHVGFPNHRNYSFDPRTLAVELVWSGRFLSLKHEKQGRADAPSELGKSAKKWPNVKHLFQPILTNRKGVDFFFKEPNSLSQLQVHQLLFDKQEFQDELAQIDARFQGVDTPYNDVPRFNYRVEDNQVAMTLKINDEDKLLATFDIDTKSPLRLSLKDTQIANINISKGKIIDDVWYIPSGLSEKVLFSANLVNSPKTPILKDNIVAQQNAPQALVWSDASNDKTFLPNGYRIENAAAPNDKFGRQVLFEPLGIVFTPQGNAYVSTRTSGVWKIVNNQWQQFAEGVFDSLGVVVDDENTIVIGEKPGLTRLIDRDNDGWAEKRESLSDQFRFDANYHEYLHGPIKNSKGEYFYTLNLGHSLPGGYSGDGSMVTSGGYRGWAMKVDKNKTTTPFAYGLRSPAGLAITSQDKIYYTDNQGDFHGTSKLYVLKADTYYGHPASLIDLPNMSPQNSEIQWRNMKDKRDLPVVLLPHARAMNSPGSPVWDTTQGSFGPYKGQMFIGDQSQSSIFRVQTETVNGIEQGVLMPFMAVTSSGVMRLTFSPNDHSLWIGQTGRGWWAKGGNLSALQRIVYDSKTLPQSIYSVEIQPDGFKVNLTQPIAVDKRISFNQTKVSSWYYFEDYNYGSAEKDVRMEKTQLTHWSDDGKSFFVKINNFSLAKNKVPEQTSRVYELDLSKTYFGQNVNGFHAKAWYTVNSIPLR